MRPINNSTAIGNQSSDTILYTGSSIDCLGINCTNPKITDVIEAIGQVTCFNNSQINSLTSVNTYCKNIGCDAKTLLNLFNVVFQSICTLESGLLNTLVGEKPTIKYIGTCQEDPAVITIPENTLVISPNPVTSLHGYYDCTWEKIGGVFTQTGSIPTLPDDYFCFFKTDATCTACSQIDLITFYGMLVSGIQNLNWEIYNVYSEICETKSLIFNALNNIVAQSGGAIYNDVMTLDSCTNTFLPYLINTTVTDTNPNITKLLGADMCRMKTILGSRSDIIDLYDYVKTLRCADTEGLITDYTLDNNAFTGIGANPGDVNIIKYTKVLFNAMCTMNSKLNTFADTLGECCKTDCDVCLQYGMTPLEFNYGIFTSSPGTVIPGGLITDNTKPQIVFQENISLNCNGDTLDNSLSKYIISDGVRTISFSLDQIIAGSVTGITVLSGTTPGSNAIYILDLQALGLSYLANITIRQKLRTVVFKCDSSDKILIPGYTGASCGNCVVCLKCKTTECTSGSATFTYNGETYFVDLNNPCISIPLYNDSYGRPIPIVNINYDSDDVQLTSDCGEFGLSPFCGTVSTNTENQETCKWRVTFDVFNFLNIFTSLGANTSCCEFHNYNSITSVLIKINGTTLDNVTLPSINAYDDDIQNIVGEAVKLLLLGTGVVVNATFDNQTGLIEFCANSNQDFSTLNITFNQEKKTAPIFAVTGEIKQCSNCDPSSYDTDPDGNLSGGKELVVRTIFKTNSLFQKVCDCCISCNSSLK